MSSIERAVREALASPNTIDEAGGFGSRRNLYCAYADTPDDTLIRLPYNHINRVPTDDLDDFAKALRLAIWLGRIPDSFFPTIGCATVDDYIRETVEHEQAHAEAARALSVQSIRYGLMVITHARARLMLVPLMDYAGTIPKIGAAAIHVFPNDPSPGDESGIRMLGYADAHEVRWRAGVHNESGSGPVVPIRRLFGAQG